MKDFLDFESDLYIYLGGETMATCIAIYERRAVFERSSITVVVHMRSTLVCYRSGLVDLRTILRAKDCRPAR
jgi:hypothetical protein